MARCDLCGNDYDKAFTVTRDGETRTFDSFECAIIDDGSIVQSLPVQDHRPWGRSLRPILLLRALRKSGGRQRTARSRGRRARYLSANPVGVRYAERRPTNMSPSRMASATPVMPLG